MDERLLSDTIRKKIEDILLKDKGVRIELKLKYNGDGKPPELLVFKCSSKKIE